VYVDIFISKHSVLLLFVLHRPVILTLLNIVLRLTYLSTSQTLHYITVPTTSQWHHGQSIDHDYGQCCDVVAILSSPVSTEPLVGIVPIVIGTTSGNVEVGTY